MKHWIDRSILSFWADKEMKIEAAHLLDLCDTVFRAPAAVWTPFLGQALSNWLEGVLRRENFIYRIDGGFPEPERARFLISQEEKVLQKARNEVALLAAQPIDPRGTLEHRQVLGSLMGLGLKRELIGDIRPVQQGLCVAVSLEIADYLVREWNKAGRERIRVHRIEGEPEVLPDKGEECRITVSSSRLDAVASSSFKVSRTVFQGLIMQGKVKRNDLVVVKTDTELKPGDIISCRGYGRIRLLDSSETRKGRIAWNIVLYKPQRH
jgi:RNA-binding protein YlmH